MKKVVSLFLALLLCLTLLPGPVWAASGSCGSDMNWTLSSGCLTITGGGTMTSTPWKTYSSEIHSIIVRPDDGWSLDLADHAFSDLTNLTEVEIKQGVTTISEYAFSGCGKLRYLSLPMYVTVVLPYAFSGCTSLEYVSYAGETDSLSLDKGNEDLARCLPVRPYIYSDPTNVTVNEGGVATFSVKASGSDIPNYQWQYWSESGWEWVNVTASDITGAESATMKVPGKASRNGMEYRCEVTNSYGTNWSSHATLTVKCKPTITTQPSSKTVSAGTNA